MHLLARAMERACFDYLIIEDSSMVPYTFRGSHDTYLRYAASTPKLDPFPEDEPSIFDQVDEEAERLADLSQQTVNQRWAIYEEMATRTASEFPADGSLVTEVPPVPCSTAVCTRRRPYRRSGPSARASGVPGTSPGSHLASSEAQETLRCSCSRRRICGLARRVGTGTRHVAATILESSRVRPGRPESP